MKNIKGSLLLLSVPMLLTGCFRTSVSQDKFAKQIDTAKASIALDSSRIDNVHIHNKLSVDNYNYKKGEFYSYHMFAIALIVPITHGEYTWKDGDKYYHALTYTDSSKNKTAEIDEAQFNTYMETHRVTIQNLLQEPVSLAESLLNKTNETYTVKSNALTYEAFSSEYRLVSKVSYQEHDPNNYDQMITRDKTYTYKMKKGLPSSMTYKENWENGSEQTWSYSYGDATFSDPTKSNESEQ